MLSKVLLVSSIAAAGAHAAGHNHQHMHLHARDMKLVTEVVTEWVTQFVYPDGELVPPTTPPTPTTTSSPGESGLGLEAIFVQKSATTSTSAAPSPPPTTTTTPPVIPTIPSAAPPPDTTTPAPPVGGGSPEETVDGFRIYTIVNSHSAAVSTSHDDTVGTPTSNGAKLSPGTMAPGATATFAAPPGWVGNIAFSDASFPVGPSCSLIEANFVEWFGALRADFDISYVNGFSLPASCSCAGETGTGCTLDLLSQSCPGGLVDGACPNPLRADEVATSASPFFSACEGAAWSFVNDGNANADCLTGSIVCCIGANCPSNPKQGSL